MASGSAWLREQIAERLRFYAEMGTLGLRRSRPGSAETPAEKLPVVEPAADAPRETLEAIRADLGDCTRCPLHAGRTHIVFGVGNPSAELMFVGEGPGYHEDQQGEPFVGKAGQLLTKIIQAIDMKRQDVYIANVVKCRPPQNREPAPEEAATCRPFLERQIASVRPHVICTLGRVATQLLLETTKPMRSLRGQIISYGSALVVPTYHPAFLLRNPEKKRETWQDVQLVQRLLHEQR